MQHIRESSKLGTQQEQIVAENYSLETILSKIHYFRVRDFVEQMALIYNLPNILREKPNVLWMKFKHAKEKKLNFFLKKKN